MANRKQFRESKNRTHQARTQAAFIHEMAVAHPLGLGPEWFRLLIEAFNVEQVALRRSLNEFVASSNKVDSHIQLIVETINLAVARSEESIVYHIMFYKECESLNEWWTQAESEEEGD